MRNNSAPRQQTFRIVVAFACIYLFWGSAFVALRYSVQMVHPAFVAGIRYVLAGLILFAFLLARGQSPKLGRRDLAKVTGLGLLMFTCNTLLLGYGGKTLSAGLTALLIATIPLFICVLQALLWGKAATTPWSWVGVLTGFLGIALLLQQSTQRGLLPEKAVPAALALLVAALAWALGSVLLSRMRFQAPPLVCTCWQMLIGGAVDILIGLGAGGYATSQWNGQTWLSMVFLSICGTLVGYTSYSFLLRHVSISSVATYAYINPLVAALLGWLLLNEPLTASQWMGFVIVLGSVAFVVNLPNSRREDGRVCYKAEVGSG